MWKRLVIERVQDSLAGVFGLKSNPPAKQALLGLLAGGFILNPGRRCQSGNDDIQLSLCHSPIIEQVAGLIFSPLFFTYGAECFFSAGLEREFVHYRMEWLRRMVGTLQIAAAFGLLGGLSQPWLGQAAAVGLALMMLVAVGARIKIRDTLLQTLPALFYLALNAYLALVEF